jgi:hypothetical protein
MRILAAHDENNKRTNTWSRVAARGLGCPAQGLGLPRLARGRNAAILPRPTNHGRRSPLLLGRARFLPIAGGG